MIKLTGQAEADELRAMTFDTNQTLYPVEDINGDWFISEEEFMNPTFAQVAVNWTNYPRTQFIPKPIEQ